MTINRERVQYFFAVVLIALSVCIIGFSVVRALPVKDIPAYVPGACQYPDRLSNPPGGCDNSEPADPTCYPTEAKEVCDTVLDEIVAPAALETVVYTVNQGK